MSTQTIKCSIVIPTYNSERYIEKSIRSAQNQTEKGIEILVSDNCSSDSTIKIVELMQRADPRIKLFRNPVNLGPVLNWKSGCSHAQGEKIVLLFSDDWLSSAFVERLAKRLDNGQLAFAQCAVLRHTFPSDPVRPESLMYQRRADGICTAKDYIDGLVSPPRGGPLSPVSPACSLFRATDLKTALESVPADNFELGYLSHGAGPDLWCYMRCLFIYEKFWHETEPLANFLARPGAESTKPGIALAYSGAVLQCLEIGGSSDRFVSLHSLFTAVARVFKLTLTGKKSPGLVLLGIKLLLRRIKIAPLRKNSKK